MNEDNIYDLRWEPYVYRGALGGAIGTLVVILAGAAYNWIWFGAKPFDSSWAVLVVAGPISGVIAGLAIGYLIYKVSNRMGKQPDKLVRIAIGVGCMFAYALFTYLTKSRPMYLVFELGFAVMVGGLAGLMARAKDTAEFIPVSATHE